MSEDQVRRTSCRPCTDGRHADPVRPHWLASGPRCACSCSSPRRKVSSGCPSCRKRNAVTDMGICVECVRAYYGEDAARRATEQPLPDAGDDDE